MTTSSAAALFEPQTINGLSLDNRIVMSPMGFHTAADGVPSLDVADYYRLRARGGTGLIITEATAIGHPAACDNPLLLHFSSDAALEGWREVVKQVHAEGARIIPELWHVGLIFNRTELMMGTDLTVKGREHLIGPSGLIYPDRQVSEPMNQTQIDEVIDAFARGAEDAIRLGFDGVEVHGAHGFLIDQFFWSEMNKRTDGYGGSMRNRARFGAEVVAEVRHRVGPDTAIAMRISQWKLQDYGAKVVGDPQELEEWLTPLAEAGVDVFDCSQRRYWVPEFEGSDLNLAGWAKKVTGKPTITVGSVSLSRDMQDTISKGAANDLTSIDPLLARLNRDEFDLVAVGRALIADAEWANKVRSGRFGELIPFSMQMLLGSPSHSEMVIADNA